ncbi:MAG: hypothetical protein LBV41_11705 [Cytophagaceae bacterium]|jgi:hypothetical protein|nr:hypothetical protein [Cytophagaceae bacterium]
MIQEILTYTTVALAFVYAAIRLIRAFRNSGSRQCTNCCGCEARMLRMREIGVDEK